MLEREELGHTQQEPFEWFKESAQELGMYESARSEEVFY